MSARNTACSEPMNSLYPGRKQTAPLNREIIDITLVDGDLNAYHEMHHSQGGKPYYIPDKADGLLLTTRFTVHLHQNQTLSHNSWYAVCV